MSIFAELRNAANPEHVVTDVAATLVLRSTTAAVAVSLDVGQGLEYVHFLTLT